MINPATEQIITIAQAKHYAPPVDGRKPDRSTVWRWTMRGAKAAAGGRVILETINMPHGRATSVQAVKRFFDKVHGVTAKVEVIDNNARKQTRKRLAEAGLM